MKKRELGNLCLHIGVGGLLAALVLWSPWFLLSATFVYAWLREQAQHRLIITEMGHLHYAAYSVEKRTFFDFDWITGHRVWEIFQWVIGALVALVAHEFFFV
jgi:hypothetical protein